MALPLHQKTGQEQAPCRHCGAVDGFTRREKAMHVGEYCLACKRWNRWIPRREGLKLVKPALPENLSTTNENSGGGHVWGDPPAEEQPPKYSPRQLAHPETVDEKLAALAHDIGVLAQIVMGARDVG